MSLKNIIKEWMLPIAMLTGASVYLLYNALPAPFHKAGSFLSDLVGVLQPCLIFSMLFLTFCRIEPRELKPHRWHWWLLLIQGGMFAILGLAAWGVLGWLPVGHHDRVILIESAMLCMICPTATAAAVVVLLRYFMVMFAFIRTARRLGETTLTARHALYDLGEPLLRLIIALSQPGNNRNQW